MKCDFCATQILPITKYKFVGKYNGKRVQKTVKMCTCCDANTDQEWLREQLCWDEIKEVSK